MENFDDKKLGATLCGHPNNLPYRKSIRLKNYDYSSNGYYFVTICTQNREKLFGEIVGATLCGRPNNPDKVIVKWLLELENKFKGVKIDEYIVMPNHIHFIIKRTSDHTGSTGDHTGSTGDHTGSTGDHTGSTGDHTGSTGDHTGSPLLRDIIGWFKTMSTNEYIAGVKDGRFMPFKGHLWQRNYYEHIIRNYDDYINIAEYIQNNPLKWEEDKLYVTEVK